MKTFKTIFLTLAVIFSFTACKKEPIIENGTCYGGKLNVININVGFLEQQLVRVFVEFNKNNTMNFTMTGVKFDETMSEIDIKIMGVITKKTYDGFTFSLPQEGLIIPTDMAGAPLQQYNIKEFGGFITVEELQFGMFCGECKVSFLGKFMEPNEPLLMD